MKRKNVNRNLSYLLIKLFGAIQCHTYAIRISYQCHSNPERLV